MAPDNENLGQDEIHIWQADLTLESQNIDPYSGILSQEEITRAERFRFDRDRNRYIIVHGILRHILARYVDATPLELMFTRNPYGKPGLSDQFMKHKIFFNLSDSHDFALYAITQYREVGIDVQYKNDASEFEGIAEHNFTVSEVESIKSVHHSRRMDVFMKCWTRKEAILKCLGKGLLIPLDSFEVSVLSDDPPILLHADWDNFEENKWFIRDLYLKDDFAAAVAAKCHNLKLTHRQWKYPTMAE